MPKALMFGSSLSGSKIAQLYQAYGAAHPGLIGYFTYSIWRYRSAGKTLYRCTDSTGLSELQRIAGANLTDWQRNPNTRTFPKQVEVFSDDWGEVALELTRESGRPYTVLNMANAFFPGGAFLAGGSAQEEDIFHRSTAITSVSGSEYVFDETQFLYTQRAQLSLLGLATISPYEKCFLNDRIGYGVSPGRKVLLPDEAQVCFRGPVVYTESYLGEGNERRLSVADSSLSYTMLQNKDIFPFYEMRSAAPNLSNLKINWNNRKFDHAYQMVLRTRIAAQLDALILKGRKHVLLSAWGCGEFGNDPYEVAKLYREELAKRAHCFEHVVFAIHGQSRTSLNYQVFADQLKDCPIGLAGSDASANQTNNNPNQSLDSQRFFSSKPQATDSEGQYDEELLDLVRRLSNI